MRILPVRIAQSQIVFKVFGAFHPGWSYATIPKRQILERLPLARQLDGARKA